MISAYFGYEKNNNSIPITFITEICLLFRLYLIDTSIIAQFIKKQSKRKARNNLRTK